MNGTKTSEEQEKFMLIRSATTGDLPQIRKIYDAAKAYMDTSGNPNQWPVGYPPEDYLRQDIELSQLYVCEEDDILYGVFLFAVMEDPTYGYIDGAWMNDEPYGVIHRIASDGERRGIFKNVLEFCKEKMAVRNIKNLRIDTHADNKTMQHLVEKYDFKRCGIIYLGNGSPRIAYQLETE
jgi:ribosomal protein S18 acetylase RimI-like enzyme